MFSASFFRKYVKTSPPFFLLTLFLVTMPLSVFGQGHDRPVKSLAFSPGGELLASGGEDGTIRLYRARTGEFIRTFGGGQTLTADIAFSPDAGRIASAGWNGSAAVWNVENGGRLAEIDIADGEPVTVNAVAFSPDGSLVAVGSLDMKVRLWEPSSGRIVKSHEFDLPIPECLAFSADGKLLACGTRTGAVRVWRVEPWETIAEFKAGGHVREITFGSGGETVLIGTRHLELWNIAGSRRLDPPVDIRKASGWAFNREGNVVAAIERNRIVLYPPGGQSRKLPRRFDPSVVAASGSGEMLAAGYGNGAIDIYNAATGERTAEIPRFTGEIPLPEPPRGAPESLAGKNLFDGKTEWLSSFQTRGLWFGRDAEPGLYFKVLATPPQMVGRDYVCLPVNLGTRPFELTWEAVIDHNGGPGMFWPGVTAGVASGPPYRMGKDDVAVVMTLHYMGVFAGASEGEPYVPHANYSHYRAPKLAKLGMGGSVPAVKFSREAKGTFATGRPMRFRIRRDSRGVITFAAWCPHAGQTAWDPWWKREWKLPVEYSGTALDYLFVKRVGVAAVHLGQQSTGYGDIFKLSGRFSRMTLKLDPPVVEKTTWKGPLCVAGDEITVSGSGFTPDLRVTVGGEEAGNVQHVSGSELRLKVPDIPAGRRYDVAVSRPGGPGHRLKDALPLGRLLEDISLRETVPAGGGEVILHGQGFTEKTEIYFGSARADIIELTASNRAKVRVPAGKPGRVTVTAREGNRAFAGKLKFGYTPRPSLFFDRDELAGIRKRISKGASAGWLEKIVKHADAVAGGKVAAKRALRDMPALIWGYAFTGNEKYIKPLGRWIEAVSETGIGRVGEADAMAAMAYDLTAPQLPVELRAKAVNYFLDLQNEYLRLDNEGNWHVTAMHSFNPGCNGPAAAVSAAVRNASGRTEEALDAAERNLRFYIESAFGPDGGSVEGLSWGVSGLQWTIRGGQILARHRGNRGLLEHPHLERIGHLYRSMLATPRDFCRFGNMHSGLKGLGACGVLGARYDDPLLLWSAGRLFEKAGRKEIDEAAMAMLAGAPEKTVAEPPPVPVLSVLEDIQCGVMRSAPVLDAPFAVGVKGSDGPLSYHFQKDVGSFVFFAHGTELVRDPGWGSMKAEDHSIPVIDGVEGDASGGFITDTFTNGPWRAVVLDATHNREPWGIKRFRRTVLLHAQGRVVVLDDIVPAEGSPGEVVSRFQTPEADLTGNPRGAVTKRGNAVMRIRFFGPETELSVQDRKRGRHWKGKWQAVTVRYTADEKHPLVTVLAAGKGESAPEVEAELVYGDKSIVVDLPGIGRAEFKASNTGWACVAGERGGPERLLDSPPPRRELPMAGAVRARKPPVIDGKLDDPVWQSAPPAPGFVLNNTWKEDLGAEFDTGARFAYDRENLYVALRCYEPEPDGLVTNVTGPAQGAHGNDHVVLFLDPGFERRKSAYAGCALLADGRDLGPYGHSGNLGRGLISAAAARAPAGDNGKSAWTLEAAWPWESILFDRWHEMENPPGIEPGERMGLNIQRYRAQRPRETSCWTRCYAWPQAMPWRWGILLLQ
ncbi:MAG: IPT/TIG domain-containing protein [Kiritimatiellia bacterium]